MNYLHYQYCLSDFVVLDSYETEYFTKEDAADELNDQYHQTMLSNIIAYTRDKNRALEGRLKRVYVRKEVLKSYINDDQKLVTYDPLSDTPELYLEINKIKLLDDKSLMKFIQNYGIPYHQQIPKGGFGVYPTNLYQNNENEKLLIGMDVLMFYEGLAKLKKAIKMWNDIKENNTEEMQKMKDDFKFHAEFYDKHESEFTQQLTQEEFARMVFAELGFVHDGEIQDVLEDFKNDPEKIKMLSEKASELKILWEQVKNEDLKIIALAYLNLELKKLKSGKTSTRFTKGKIVPAISFKNLFEVAAYQLKQAIFKDMKLERCQECDALFEPRHARQKFCPPLLNRKRSTCENTFNVRLKRQRKKE